MVRLFSPLSIFLLTLMPFQLCGCHVHRLSPVVSNSQTATTIIEPVNGAVIPGNISKIQILWDSPNTPADGTWLVTLSTPKTARSLSVSGKSLVIGQEDLSSLGKDAPVALQVCAKDLSNPASACSEKISFTLGSDELAETIIYRTVEPLFNAAQQSSIMQLSISAQPRQVFSKEATCIGCHARSSKGMLALNLRRGIDRRLAIFQEQTESLTLVAARKIGEFSYLAWSPDGRYLAMIVNTFGLIDVKNDVSEPFGLSYKSGDLAIYDMATGEIKPLPGASEMDFVEDMPTWSGDGKELLFVRYKPEKDGSIADMDIYTIPFNGGNGGTAIPVNGASFNGHYNYFPSFSPDGAWISFVRGDGAKGIFARKSSDIYLLPRAGGVAKRLELNRDGEMDSWHRWSSDGKWLVFAGKRNGGMTALYASRIDGRGAAAPPFKLAGYEDRKINIPEFVAAPFTDGELDKVFSEAIDSIFSSSP